MQQQWIKGISYTSSFSEEINEDLFCNLQEIEYNNNKNSTAKVFLLIISAE